VSQNDAAKKRFRPRNVALQFYRCARRALVRETDALSIAGILPTYRSVRAPSIDAPVEESTMTSTRNPFPKVAAEMMALSTLAPLVIGSRVGGLWLSGFGIGKVGSDEAERMVWEKVQAGYESIIAMNMAMGSAFVGAASAAMAGAPGKILDADGILSAGLKPYSDRVRANRRRLSRGG
jgi:hypothetical protein